jgi:hypothetical protein
MALSSFTSAVLYLGGRNPNKILFVAFYCNYIGRT